jgi:tetratricopeptide (TPR) repeat protein
LADVDKKWVFKLDKVGRNDPCPCGSGRKYKKCCMLKDKALSSDADVEEEEGESAEVSQDSERSFTKARTSEIENIFHRGCNYLEKNEFDRAAKAFKYVLTLDPAHYKALTGMGRCLDALGMREEARKCFQKALEINPDYTQASINLNINR